MGQLRTANKRRNRALARIRQNVEQVTVAPKPVVKAAKA